MSENFTGLWPTPKANGNRNSRRRAILGGHPKHPGKSDLSLEQAIEVAAGILPREVNEAAELPLRFREALAPIASPQLTLFAEAFPVSRIPLLADAVALKTSATSGPSSPDSFASLDPDGSWRKTCQGYSQVTLDGSLERFSETWPRAGMTRSGTAYQRVPLAPLTDATASGSWPTPDTHQGGRTLHNVEYRGRSAYSADGVKRTISLEHAARMWPTPRAEHDSGRHRGQPDTLHSAVKMWPTPTTDRYSGLQSHGCNAILGQLNPTWVEWLMGYPLGWTACAAWATRSSRRSRNGSRAASSRPKASDDVAGATPPLRAAGAPVATRDPADADVAALRHLRDGDARLDGPARARHARISLEVC